MAGMLDATNNSDKPQDYKEQVFIGRVVVNDDIKMFHRIKVEIPDIWDEYTQDQLPWCVPHHLPGGSGPTETSQNIPETGSFVYITFQNGNNHNPVYWGGVRDFRTVQGVLAKNYPHRVGWQLNSFTEEHAEDERHRIHVVKGDPVPYPRYIHHFFVDRMTNEVEYKHATETKINIADNGRVFFEVRARDLPDGGDFITHTDRHYEIEVSNAKFEGDPGHYLCKVLEDWWLTQAKTWVKLESIDETIDLLCPKNITIESTQRDVVVKAAGNVRVIAGGNVVVEAEGDITATAGGNISATAPNISLNGAISLNGNVAVSGNMTVGGTVVDGDGDGGA